ncbi:hypothetical protein [Kalamiella sp. sgz302252]|uniref:hypothetical protein n=1 Tax=Pantoea sp. sgz302252 TaxID=3341827 RepID=UPI0036D26E05
MKIIFAVLLFLLLPLSVSASPPVTAEKLAKDIEKQGPEKVISELYTHEEKDWRYVTEQIAKGDDNWLHIAALLAPGADADSAETLSVAVGLAIPHNPSGVLHILTNRYISLSPGEICGLPFYNMTEAQFNQYVLDSIRALYKVPSSKACIDIMVNIIGQSDKFREDI